MGPPTCSSVYPVMVPHFPWDHLRLSTPAVLPATSYHEKDHPVVSERQEGDIAGQTPQAGQSTLGSPASSPARRGLRAPPQPAPPSLPAQPAPPKPAPHSLPSPACSPHFFPVRPSLCCSGAGPCGDQVFITRDVLHWGVLVTSEIPTGEGSVPRGAHSWPPGPHWGTWYAVGCVSFHTFSAVFHWHTSFIKCRKWTKWMALFVEL